MAAVDDLIGALAADGELAAEGDFTLDREKARDKMRQFQLADPHRYVLMLIGAAAEKGATRTDFRIDTDDMEMRFGGDPFTREDVEELYVSMFGDRTDRGLRARQDLAVALNAAMALNPRWIRLQSAGSDGRGVKVTMRPGADDDIEDAEGLPEGTRIHVKDRFRAGLLLKFVDNLRGRVAEEVVIREHCRHSERPVWIDGERVGTGMDLGDVWGAVAKANERAHVVAGFDPLGAPARLIVLVHGVELALHSLEGFPRGFVAMADCSHLRRDVSFADVVRDQDYMDLLAMLQGVAHAAMTKLIADVGYQVAGVPAAAEDEDDEGDEGDEDDDDEDDAVPAATTMALARIDTSDGLRPWVPVMLRAALERFVRAKTKDERREVQDLVEALRSVRLWTTIAGEHVDTRHLDAAGKRVAFTTELVEHYDVEEHAGTVYAPTRAARGALRRLFGKRVVDRTRTLVREAEQHANRQRWRARPRQPVLGDGMYYARVPLESKRDGVRGELGLRRGGNEGCTVTVIVDGCLLLELAPKIAIPGFVAIIEAPLEPNANFDALKRTADLGALLADILVSAKTLMERAAASMTWDADTDAKQWLFCSYLWQLETRRLATELFAAFGYKERSIDYHVRRNSGGGRRPVWAPDWELDDEEPHPIATLPLFPCLGEPHVVSLVDIARDFEERGAISIIGRKLQEVTPPRLVLTVGAARRSTLASIFGSAAVVDATSEHAGWLARHRHLRKSQLEFALSRETSTMPMTFGTPRGHGLVALGWPDAAGPVHLDHYLRLEVRVESRFVTSLTEPCAFPGVVAMVDDPDIAVDTRYDGLEDDAERTRVTTMVMQPLVEHLRQLIPADQASVVAGEVGHVQWMLAATFPKPAWHRAFRMLIDFRGPAKAQEAYLELLALRTRWSEATITERLLVGLRNRHLSTASIERALESNEHLRGRNDDDPNLLLHRGFAELLPQLRSLAVYCKADGGMASLDDLWAYIDEGNKLRWLPLTTGHRRIVATDTGGALIVVLTEIERRTLEAIVGTVVMENAEAWLVELAERRAFESREQLESLTLDPGDVLVAVPVKRRGFVGAIGLPRKDPTTASPTVLACRERRPLGSVHPDVDTPIMAVLSSDDLGDASAGPLPEADLDRLGQVCTSYLGELVGELAQTLRTLRGDERELAAAWVRWFMLNRGAAVGHAGIQSLGALDPLDVFVLADGSQTSLDALKAAHRKHTRLRAVLSGRASGASAPGEPVLDLRSPARRQQIEALFGAVENHFDLAEREREIAARRTHAAPLPQAPADALAVVAVHSGGLRGQVWIQPPTVGGSQLHLGHDGRVVETRLVGTDEPLRHLLPFGGAVSGSGARVDDAFTTITLRERAVRVLERCSLALYNDLATSFEERLAAGATAAEDADQGRARESVVRTRLAAAAVQLTRDSMTAVKTGGGTHKLRRRLASLPLLQLNTGRKVSVEVARRERPRELWHLGLWDEEQAAAEVPVAGPPTPPEVPEVAELIGTDSAAPPAVEEPVPERPAAVEEPAQPGPEAAIVAEIVAADFPVPAPPTPEELLLEAIRSELRLVRADNRELLSDAHLDGVRIAARNGSLVAIPDAPATLDAANPVVEAVLEDGGSADAVTVSFLASAVYTAINIKLGEVTDADEAEFLRRHAEHVASTHIG